MMRGERGQSLIEFALVLPVLVIVLVGVFDLGRAVMLSETLNNAVREGARHAIVHGATSSSPLGPATLTTPPAADNTATAEVRRHAIGINSSITIVMSWPDGNANKGSEVQIIATTPFTPILSQVFTGGGIAVTLRSGTTMVIQQ
jgi:Flp pilus assembly protein TadG